MGSGSAGTQRQFAANDGDWGRRKPAGRARLSTLQQRIGIRAVVRDREAAERDFAAKSGEQDPGKEIGGYRSFLCSKLELDPSRRSG